MVTITLSAAGAKGAANRLREFLAIDGINLKQTHAYEALAQMLGYANWNTLQALLGATSSYATNSLAGKQADELIAERPAQRTDLPIAIPLDPVKFDKFVGCYQFTHDWFVTIARRGDQFLARMTGSAEVEIYPSSEITFFMTQSRAQYRFNINAQGFTESVRLYDDRNDLLAERVDESVVKAFEYALQKYIADNKPTPERDILLRRHLAASLAGAPDLEILAPVQIEITKRLWPTVHQTARRLGKLTELKFLHVNSAGDRAGWDVYDAIFENGKLIYQVGPLTPDHKLEGLWYDFP